MNAIWSVLQEIFCKSDFTRFIFNITVYNLVYNMDNYSLYDIINISYYLTIPEISVVHLTSIYLVIRTLLRLMILSLSLTRSEYVWILNKKRRITIPDLLFTMDEKYRKQLWRPLQLRYGTWQCTWIDISSLNNRICTSHNIRLSTLAWFSS